MRAIHCLLVLILAFAASQALGHARLASSTPDDDGRLDAGEGLVVLTFSEPIQPRFSDFVFHYLGDDSQASPSADNRLPRRSPKVDDAHTEVELRLPEDAAPGWYVLDWEVLADDGHTTSGTLRFQLTD